MYMEKNKHCRECICLTCEAFKTNECLEGENGCDKCVNNSHTVSCPYYKDAFKE